MKELYILLAPALWSARNSIIRFDRAFYKKVFFYFASCGLFLFLVTRLLNMGMSRLQSLSADVFNVLLIKGYSLIFIIIFFIQMVNGFVISLNTYYQSKELEVLLTSPVDRTSLFFSRLFETHIKASWMLIIFGIPLLISSGLLYHADLLYYIYAPAVFAAFSIIPVNIGIGMAIVVSSIFHIRRLKRSLVSTGIVAFVLLVTLLRVFRPERFVNPELFANLTFFISELNTPSFILLPNRWLSESLFGFLRNAFRTDTFIVFTLLFLTSYVTTLFLHGIFKRYHYRGWGLLQQGGILLKEKGARVHRTIPFLKRIGAILCVRQLARMVDRQSAALIRKDLLLQLRDPQNIHQMLILVSLIIIYLFSMASLPLNWEGYAVRLKYIISFFNLGLILIIIASLCSRLVYPAVVSEGASLWTIRISPVTSRRYIWTKFLAFLLPVFVLGQSLTIFSSFFLGTEKALLALNISTVGLLSFSLVSLGIAFGVADVRRTAVETAQGRTKTANTAHMLFSILLILFTLAVETIPFFLYFLKEARQTALTQKGWIIIGSILFLVSGVNSLITVVLLRSGVRKFEKVQFS